MPKESKHTEASFLPISTDSLCLRVAQIPRSRDVAIFVVMTNNRRQTKLIALSLAHARGVKIATKLKSNGFLYVYLFADMAVIYGIACILVARFTLL